MIPTKPSRIFRSRWWALFWAAGVIWTAVSVAGSPPHHAPPAQPATQKQAGDDGQNGADRNSNDSGLTDADGQPVSRQQIQMIANLVG